MQLCWCTHTHKTHTQLSVPLEETQAISSFIFFVYSTDKTPLSITPPLSTLKKHTRKQNPSCDTHTHAASPPVSLSDADVVDGSVLAVTCKAASQVHRGRACFQKAASPFMQMRCFKRLTVSLNVQLQNVSVSQRFSVHSQKLSSPSVQTNMPVTADSVAVLPPSHTWHRLWL